MGTVELFVDWSPVVTAHRFRTRAPAATRWRLHAGDTVVVLSDDVAPARARVLAVDHPEVEFELLDEPGPTADPSADPCPRTAVDLDDVRAQVAAFEAEHPASARATTPTPSVTPTAGSSSPRSSSPSPSCAPSSRSRTGHPPAPRRGGHAGPGPTSEQARAADRAGHAEPAARRLAALDEFLDQSKAAHGPIGAEEMEAAVRRLRARGPGRDRNRALPPALVWRRGTAAELEEMRARLRDFEERYGAPSDHVLEVAAFHAADGLVETDDLVAWSSLWDRYRGLTEPLEKTAPAVKARVRVDIHLSPDGVRTLASTSDVSPPVTLTPGDLVEVTDGESTRPAIVDPLDGDTVSLVVR
ncbi:hypothetical protein ACI8AC_10195 [Geodermatophilus sp. SYSU D00758]